MNQTTDNKKDNTECRVAFDLMMIIAESEYPRNNFSEKPNDPRDYYFTLYHQCLNVAQGKSPFAQDDQ